MSKKKTKVIREIPENPFIQGQAKRKKLRVAAYCRVSTEQEEQESSFENQVAYYTDLIQSNPEWEFAGIFADRGISGTKDTIRPEFMKMIEHCQRHKIDLIFTKSLSRFSPLACLERQGVLSKISFQDISGSRQKSLCRPARLYVSLAPISLKSGKCQNIRFIIS